MFLSEEEELYMVRLAYNLETEELALEQEDEQEGTHAPKKRLAVAKEPNSGQETIGRRIEMDVSL
jgi:hypothetical protein